MSDTYNKKFYYGYSLNSDVLESASGGAAYELYKQTINRRGIVYGVKWTEDFCDAQYSRVDKREDLNYLRGSKYIKASMMLKNGKTLYQSVLDDIIDQYLVTIVGLPCEINGLISYLKSKGVEDMSNLVTIDLICHGPGQSIIQKEYVTYLEKRFNSKIISFNTRYKNPNWGRSFLRIEFDNGKEYIQEFYKTELGIATNFMGKACGFCCKCKGNNRKADITIGDYWRCSKADKNYYSKGMSLLITNSYKGDKLINELNDFRLVEIPTREEALKGNPYYSESREKPNEYEQFANDFNKYGVKVACIKGLGIKRVISFYFPVLFKLLKYLRRKKYEED